MEDRKQARVSGAWKRLSPLSVVFILAKGALRFIRENLAVLVGVGAGVALLERIGTRELAAGAAALGVLASIGAFTYYRRFRYRLEDDVLRVRRGVFEVSEIELRADRIQHIGVREPVYMRIFGLAIITVSTPGAGSNEVDLPGVSRAEALALANELGAARAADAATPERTEGQLVGPGSDVRFRATGAGITLHGVASQSILVAAAALAPIAGQLLPRLEGAVARYAGAALAAVEALVGSTILAWIVLAAGALVLLVSASVVAAWIQYFGYELSRDGDRYTQQSGLLSRQAQTLTLSRLQSVHWVETALGRALGRCYLLCRQTGSASREEHTGGTFTIPALARREASRVLGELWQGAASAGALASPHPRYRRAVLLRLLFPLSAVAVIAAAVTGRPLALAWIPVLGAGLWPLAHLRFRAVAYRVGDRFALVRRGLVGRRTVVVPLERIQRVAVSQSIFQRRYDLASLTITLADGPVSIPYIPEPEARALADRIVYRIETTLTKL